MPQKKKSSKAAKKRFDEQGSSNTGQFNIKDKDYVPSSDEYSKDSSDDEFINERIQQLSNFTLIWSDNAHNKLKKNIPEILGQQNFENMVLQESLLKLQSYHNQ
jgi:hypothetical protein